MILDARGKELAVGDTILVLELGHRLDFKINSESVAHGRILQSQRVIEIRQLRPMLSGLYEIDRWTTVSDRYINENIYKVAP